MKVQYGSRDDSISAVGGKIRAVLRPEPRPRGSNGAARSGDPAGWRPRSLLRSSGILSRAADPVTRKRGRNGADGSSLRRGIRRSRDPKGVSLAVGLPERRTWDPRVFTLTLGRRPRLRLGNRRSEESKLTKRLRILGSLREAEAVGAFQRDCARAPDLYRGNSGRRASTSRADGFGVRAAAAAIHVRGVGPGGTINVDAAGAQVHVPHDERLGKHRSNIGTQRDYRPQKAHRPSRRRSPQRDAADPLSSGPSASLSCFSRLPVPSPLNPIHLLNSQRPHRVYTCRAPSASLMPNSRRRSATAPAIIA